MSITPSLSPLSSDQFGPPEAAHLLRRAGFGPTPAKVDELVALGPDAAVAAMVDVQAVERGDIKSQFDLDPDVRRPLTDDEKELRRKAREEARNGGGEAKAVVEFGSMSVAQDEDESSEEEEEEDDDDYDDDFDEDEEEAAAPSAARAADSGRRQPMKGYDSDDGVIETEVDD